MENNKNNKNNNTKFIDELKKHAEMICRYFNDELMLLNLYTIYFKFYPEYKIIKFYLENKDSLYKVEGDMYEDINTYDKISIDSIASSKASYYIQNGKRFCSGRGVISNIPGSSLGSFLFHLQVLLAKKMNTDHYFLENFTDNPSRAASGIYELFHIKNRNSNNNNNNIYECFDPRNIQNFKKVKINTRSTRKKAKKNLKEYDGLMCLNIKLIQFYDILQKIKFDIIKTNNSIIWNMKVVKSRWDPHIFKNINTSNRSNSKTKKRSRN